MASWHLIHWHIPASPSQLNRVIFIPPSLWTPIYLKVDFSFSVIIWIHVFMIKDKLLKSSSYRALYGDSNSSLDFLWSRIRSSSYKVKKAHSAGMRYQAAWWEILKTLTRLPQKIYWKLLNFLKKSCNSRQWNAIHTSKNLCIFAMK